MITRFIAFIHIFFVTSLVSFPEPLFLLGQTFKMSLVPNQNKTVIFCVVYTGQIFGKS